MLTELEYENLARNIGQRLDDLLWVHKTSPVRIAVDKMVLEELSKFLDSDSETNSDTV